MPEQALYYSYWREWKQADLVSFGTAFIANPDLPFRLENDIPLPEPDRTTFYSSTAAGYTDYPTYSRFVASL